MDWGDKNHKGGVLAVDGAEIERAKVSNTPDQVQEFLARHPGALLAVETGITGFRKNDEAAMSPSIEGERNCSERRRMPASGNADNCTIMPVRLQGDRNHAKICSNPLFIILSA